MYIYCARIIYAKKKKMLANEYCIIRVMTYGQQNKTVKTDTSHSRMTQTLGPRLIKVGFFTLKFGNIWIGNP